MELFCSHNFFYNFSKIVLSYLGFFAGKQLDIKFSFFCESASKAIP